jgi:hypothetical protein
MPLSAASTKAIITLLIEGDRGDNNYTVYIPELRLGSMGDTVEEARENALYLVEIERDRLRKNILNQSESWIEKVEIDLDEE